MGTTQPEPPIRILLVEDDEEDILLLRKALRGTAAHNEVEVVRDGEAALARVRHLENSGHDDPDLIILDLNLPKTKGHDVLAALKANPATRSIPVIIMTTSRSEEDVQQAYDRHAASFISKPLDAGEFRTIVKLLDSYWLSLVHLPSRSRRARRVS